MAVTKKEVRNEVKVVVLEGVSGINNLWKSVERPCATVGELIEYLSDFNEDDYVVLGGFGGHYEHRHIRFRDCYSVTTSDN